jgi:hypothetical protein
MTQRFRWEWVQRAVSETMLFWNSCSGGTALTGHTYTPAEQNARERAYDEALEIAESQARCATETRWVNSQLRQHLITAFGRFSAEALALDKQTVSLLTDAFLPIGTDLAQWARTFDPALRRDDIIQACRNAWTACGLQMLLGAPIKLTPSILAYSLLYPYSDNLLDGTDCLVAEKIAFSRRFRLFLDGRTVAITNRYEARIQKLIELIEAEYSRDQYPSVYDCLLLIHRAQEQSLHQLSRTSNLQPKEILRLTCQKGGTSVLADACLVRGSLTMQESRFAFNWGVLLQLGDDLQDLAQDIRNQSATVFTRAAISGMPLDSLAVQLLNYGDSVATQMEHLPHASVMLKHLLTFSWRSLIIGAIAGSRQFFSARFLQEAERLSPFRFQFLNERQTRLAACRGLYSLLFESVIAAGRQTAVCIQRDIPLRWA